MTTAPFDLDDFQYFRDACLAQWIDQHPTYDVLRDPRPTIIEALDAAIDEIARLRAELESASSA